MIWYHLSKTTFLSDLNEYLMLFLSYLQRIVIWVVGKTLADLI
jgi:hypothetical protein